MIFFSFEIIDALCDTSSFYSSNCQVTNLFINICEFFKLCSSIVMQKYGCKMLLYNDWKANETVLTLVHKSSIIGYLNKQVKAYNSLVGFTG